MTSIEVARVNFKKGDTVIYPQHGACIVQGTQKKTMFGETKEYLVLRSVIGEMTLSVPLDKTEEVGVRPPVSADELEDLVSVLSKPDPRVPSNWSRRFKNHQEKLKSGDVYQVAEVVRNLADLGGKTVFLTTHFMDEAEKCDRLGILEKGRLVALDTPERLKSRVGGDVIVLRTRDAQTLQSEIELRFHQTATVLEDTVRMERPNGHEFIAKLVEAFPGKIETITFSKPTLEDVFVRQTGYTFGSGEKGL
jgi:CarD family transcriptional regulator